MIDRAAVERRLEELRALYTSPSIDVVASWFSLVPRNERETPDARAERCLDELRALDELARHLHAR